MHLSVEKQIIKRLKDFKRGKIFFPKNFSDLGEQSAIRQALNRLVKKEILIRLASGIYLYPKKHKRLGVLYPSIDQIARAIAKRDKARLIPTGAQALNKLGLSTQVPMNNIYYTDGSPRTLTVGANKIKFKAASPKMLSLKSDRILLITQALRQLGQDNISSEVLRVVARLVLEEDLNLVQHDMKMIPRWITELITKQINLENEGMV